MGTLQSVYTFWNTYGSDIQNGAVVLSAIAAFWVIAQSRNLARRRGTLDLILHQESDAELIEARVEFNAIKAGTIRPSHYGQLAQINTDKAQIIRRVLNVHELTAVAIKEGVIDEKVYRTWFNTTYVKDYEAMRDYIVEARRSYTNPRAFCEFEELATRWRDDKDWGQSPTKLQRKLAALGRLWRA